MGNLYILGDYTDFLVCNSEACLFGGGEEVFCFDLVDICFNYILYKLYKLKYGIWIIYKV